jgi:hypothetical protein
MTDNVVRFCDFEKRSKQPDAASPRDPCEADIIILPVIRKFNAPGPEPQAQRQ